MKVVFLNGCSTRPQVKYLLESNVPAVIATARPIDDTIARKLSVAFYKALTKGGDEIAGGRNIRGAFESAKGFIAAGHGGRTREFVVENPVPEDVTDNLGSPGTSSSGRVLRRLNAGAFSPAILSLAYPSCRPSSTPLSGPFGGYSPSPEPRRPFSSVAAVLCASCSTC